MKILTTSVLIAGLVALGACSRTPAENKAANITSAAENRADALENQGAIIQQEYQNAADTARSVGENRADAVLNNASNAAHAAGNHSAGNMH